MRQRSENRVKYAIKVFANVPGEKAQDGIAVLLQQQVLAPAANPAASPSPSSPRPSVSFGTSSGKCSGLRCPEPHLNVENQRRL